MADKRTDTTITVDLPAEVITDDGKPGTFSIDMAYEVATVNEGQYKGSSITAGSALTFHITEDGTDTNTRIRIPLSDLMAAALVARDKAAGESA